MFEHITGWKLLQGSHDFPGPEGGTCINEAAIIAAGFEYKAVSSAFDCPPCFSRPVAAYAINLNDSMPDDLRQKLLMPFVTRLSGTADTVKVERARSRFMALETCRRIMSLLCDDVLKRPDLAKRCRTAENLADAEKICLEIHTYAQANSADASTINTYTAYAAAAYAAYAAAAYAADSAAYAACGAVDAYASYAADSAADSAAAAAAAKETYFAIAAQILDEAILLGNHPTETDIAAVNCRMEEAKQLVRA